MPCFLLAFLLAWPGAAERSRAVGEVRADGQWETDLRVAPARSSQKQTPSVPPQSAPQQRIPAATSTIASTLLWVVIGLCVAAVLLVALRDFTTRPARARAGPGAKTAVVAPDVAIQAAHLDDAEALAAQGRFAEAIHTLLLRTFADLSRHAALAPALTSREILARVPLQPEAESALRHLVQAVEVSLFGAAEPGPDDYARCRSSFQRVLASRGVAAG
ncbi:MAG: DUF4129 domain-containing protein [bacterium]